MEKYKQYITGAIILIVLGVALFIGLNQGSKQNKSDTDNQTNEAVVADESVKDAVLSNQSDVSFKDYSVCEKTLNAPVIYVNGVDIIDRVFTLESGDKNSILCEKLSEAPNKAVISGYLKNTSKDGLTWKLLINNIEYSVNILTNEIGKVGTRVGTTTSEGVDVLGIIK